ncbi:phage tail protein [Obesumbacterium proteus]|uniref:phage tail protein n=1 Tax=Obesumbacterium proteus TaxID=82983 RepID=UPI00069995DF
MAQKYKAVLTKIGAAKIAAATAGGTKINLTQMAVGDGGGTLPTPDPAQTKLIAEWHRAALNKVKVDPKHKNYLVAELVIPPEIGGFWMRELGLYDEVGDLIAVSNMAESYKPLLSEGSGRAQTLRMVVIVSDMDTVNLLIDSSTVLATQEYVDDKLLEHKQSRRHPDATLKEKGFTQLSSATNSESEALSATPKAVKAAFDKALTADENAKDANDNANERLEKNKNLSDVPDKAEARTNLELKSAAIKDVVTSQTDTTTGRIPVVGWMGLGGYSIPVTIASNSDLSKLPGIPFNAIREYKSSDGSVYLIGMSGISPSGNLVEWLAPENGHDGTKIAVRNKDSLFVLYSTGNKPTASDVGALPIGGGTVTGLLSCTQEIQTTYANSYRIAYGNYGSFWRNDGEKIYLMLTKKGDRFGSYNALRPFILDAATGELTLGKTKLSDYVHFDARYQAKGSYTPAGQAYTKAESDGRFQPKGSYTPAGQAYTKAESDTRYAKAVPFAGAGGVGTYTLVATNTTQTVTFGKPMQGAKLAMLDANQHYYAGSALAGTWIWLGHTIGIGGTWFFGMAYRSA